jgi:hypothetical protein
MDETQRDNTAPLTSAQLRDLALFSLEHHMVYVDPRTWARHTQIYVRVPLRAAARARRAWNAARRRWLLSLGPQRRREMRLDPRQSTPPAAR